MGACNLDFLKYLLLTADNERVVVDTNDVLVVAGSISLAKPAV
jgi:hypothetical protein